MPTVREYEHVPSPEVLGAAVQHCTKCGKRLAPHDHFPVRDTDGAWTCIVCPASIAPRTFVAALRDPTTGLSRAVTIEVYLRSLLVRLGPPQPAGEDGAHHAAADFSEQRPAIVAAFSADKVGEDAPSGLSLGEAATEIARAAASGMKVERERVERLIAKWAPLSNGVDDRLLADIRSGATS